MSPRILALAAMLAALAPALATAQAALTGELKRWHAVTLTFDGPRADEGDARNPFRDYRLDVTFTHAAPSCPSASSLPSSGWVAIQ